MNTKTARKTAREERKPLLRANRDPVDGKAGIGVVYPDALILRISAGEAHDDDGNTYEMSVTANGHAPLVRSGKTGRCFSIGWHELIKLAVAAGVDEPL